MVLGAGREVVQRLPALAGKGAVAAAGDGVGQGWNRGHGSAPGQHARRDELGRRLARAGQHACQRPVGFAVGKPDQRLLGGRRPSGACEVQEKGDGGGVAKLAKRLDGERAEGVGPRRELLEGRGGGAVAPGSERGDERGLAGVGEGGNGGAEADGGGRAAGQVGDELATQGAELPVLHGQQFERYDQRLRRREAGRAGRRRRSGRGGDSPVRSASPGEPGRCPDRRRARRRAALRHDWPPERRGAWRPGWPWWRPGRRACRERPGRRRRDLDSLRAGTEPAGGRRRGPPARPGRS